MKQKRPERVERRRPMVEMNLISERAKARQNRRRVGCIPPLGLIAAVGLVDAIAAGLR